MAGYCGNCGKPLTGPFCGVCGQPASPPPAPAPAVVSPPHQPSPAPQAQVPAGVPPPAKGAGLGKIILVVVLVFGVLAMMGVGAVLYGVYWAKKKVASYSAEMTGEHRDQVVVAHGSTCALLPKEELARVLGVTVEKSEEIEEGGNPGCAYFTNAEAFAQLKKMALEQVKRDSARASQRPQTKTDNPLELLKDTKDLEGVVKSLGLQEAPKDGQAFSFTVDRNASSEGWTAMRTATAALPGYEEVPGVGDHAMIGAFGHVFYAIKRNTSVQLTTIYVPDAQTRGADIARRILSHF